MRRLGPALLLVLASGLVGCGDDSAPVFMPRDSGVDAFTPPPEDGGMDAGPDAELPPMDGSVDAGEDAAVDAGPSCDDPSGPTVAIVEPAAAADPNEDEVVTSARVTVRCDASAASGTLDAESVTIVRLDESGEVVAEPAVTSVDGSYQAAFELGSLSNGPLSFRCTAETTGGACNGAELETLLDLGPRIEIVSPSSGSLHNDRMSLTYRIAPEPLGASDMEAEVVAHTLVVAGRSITPVDLGDGDYAADLDFTDRGVFPEALVGDYEIAIEATNARTPTAATRRLTQPFTVDSSGPAITFVEPDEGDLVGGRTRIAVEIDDASGIDDDTVVLRYAMMELNMVSAGGGVYEAFPDFSEFPFTFREVTLNVSAADVVGNLATASRIVKLDSVPPIASLDPPMVREGRLRSGELECSALFDPVGDDSVNDGQVVGTAAEFRARVQDLGNASFGGSGTVLFYAGVRNAQLYLLDDEEGALLVDEDGDGVCDAINPMVEPMPGDPDRAIVLDLEGIRPTGTAFYPEGQSFSGPFAGCVEGSDRTPPRPVCDESTLMTRVLPRPDSRSIEMIFGKPVVTPETCVGDAFDFQSALAEGWACAAVRTEDELGNVGVSPPLRVCFDNGVGESFCGEIAVGDIAPEGMRPSCTDGCTHPLSFADFPDAQLVVPD